MRCFFGALVAAKAPAGIARGVRKGADEVFSRTFDLHDVPEQVAKYLLQRADVYYEKWPLTAALCSGADSSETFPNGLIGQPLIWWRLAHLHVLSDPAIVKHPIAAEDI